MKALSRLACAAAMAASPVFADQQDSVVARFAESRQLYESAEYDKALAVMDAIESPDMPRELARDRALYQALCLLALDRRSDAEARVETAVLVDPLFRPGDDLAPRVRTLVQSVRDRLRPRLAQDHYRIGKAMFDQKNFQGALEEFSVVARLVDEASGRPNADGLADIQTLAAGFADLARRQLEAAPPSAASSASTIVPPVTISQQLPPWPRGLLGVHGHLTGMLEVLVTARGDVGSVTLVRGLHPTYDAMLLAAAKQWTYRPATRDGQPVAYQKRLAVSVNLQ
jgi:hypothetical protein